QIHPERAKWFNPKLIIPKHHQKWRKILDASELNNQIQTIHFKMNGTDQVRDLIRKGDWATSLDLKSAFHHLIVYPPHRPYLAFEAMGKVYQYRATSFGTQHSPIFFAQALAMVLTKIRRESDIRILNYVDDLLLLHQNKERLREQTLIIMKIIETFGWTIAQEKCEIEPKQQINFLGWTWDLKRMYIRMTDLRKQELRYQLQRLISLTEKLVPIKIKYLASIIGKLIFLRVQVREASLYLRLMDAAKTRALMNKESRENIFPPREILQQLYYWHGMIVRNQEMTLEVKNSGGSYGIRRISEGLWSDSGTTNRRYFSPTWRKEQITEEVDKQQEGDGSHILRSIQLRISLQRAANQNDPHQVRQLYRNIRFNKTKSRINLNS
ncbi:MAG: putative reverse transcriptase, partial [Streblomastix strix]